MMAAAFQFDCDKCLIYMDRLKRKCVEQFKDGLLGLEHLAIGQLFPIVPIHQLDLRPRVEGVLSNLTCDSDGKMNRFIGGRLSLPLHEFGAAAARRGGYYLGMFLGRAYQEALGGLHNLFGGLSVGRVTQSDGLHCFAVMWVVLGPSCANVLQAMQHKPKLMFEVLKRWAEEESAAREGRWWMPALWPLPLPVPSAPYHTSSSLVRPTGMR